MREPKLVSTRKIVTLSAVTLSLYVLVWYYRVNRELRDLGERHNDKLRKTRPFIALLAIVLGGLLIVPPFVSVARFVGRLQRAERLVTGRAGGDAAVLAPLLLALFVDMAGLLDVDVRVLLAELVVSGALTTLAMVLAQRRLNAIWMLDAPYVRELATRPMALGTSTQ